MPNSTLSRLLGRLWPHILPHRRAQIGLLFLLMILSSFAEVISIGAVLPFLGVLTAPDRIFSLPLAQPFINALNITEPQELLLPLTAIFIFAALLSGSMRLVLLWIQTRLSHAIGADLSINIYRRTLYQPYAVHVARNSSEVIAGISGKANTVVYSTLLPLMHISSSSLTLIFILFTFVTIEPMAIAAFGGFAAIYGVVVLATKKALARDSERVSHESNQVIKALQEGLGGIRDVLIDGTQATYCKIFRSADLPLRRSTANVLIIMGTPRYAIEALGMILIAVFAYALAGNPSGMVNAIPVLGALALGAQRLLPVLQLGYSGWSQIRGSQASLADALDLLDQPMPAHADAPLPTPLPFEDNITLKGLAFRYAENTPWVLKHGLNLSIKKGSRVGFIGTTGSGKSTLLDILMGLLQSPHGELAIDGIKITEENHRGWQAHIAHVPQAIFLADASIAENIAFGIPLTKIDNNRVREVAMKAQVAEAIESWPEQYDTVVGERGVKLSGGQRQRIGIARALYKRADVIVFDEATSALDNDTERAVMEAIENLGAELTIIIVAHRLTTLENCDEIIELEDGRIKRSGSYENIMSQSI